MADGISKVPLVSMATCKWGSVIYDHAEMCVMQSSQLVSSLAMPPIVDMTMKEVGGGGGREWKSRPHPSG